MGSIYESNISPFVSTVTPNNQLDIHTLLRDEEGNVKLGDFLKMNPDFVQAAFGEGVSLGANLE